MKLKWYLLSSVISIAITLQSCGPGDPGVWKNGEITSGIQGDMHKLNDQLFDAVKTNKTYDAEGMMSRELLNSNDYKRTLELIGLHMGAANYNMLDEYYIINLDKRDTHTIKTSATDGNRYTFYCPALAEEMYAAFMVPKTTGDKYIVSLIYLKYDYGWRLHALDIQPYTITGKTAPLLYEQAQEQYKKGYIVDAYNTMDLVDKTMRPNELWQYPQDLQMTTFRSTVAQTLSSYTFPVIVDVPTKPKIFEVTHLSTNEGVFPAVHYLSSIDIKDTAALKKESENVKLAIGKVFPGIDKDKKYIFFSAFNQKPTSKRDAPSYDMTVKLP
jgi:hypothetical protein